MSKLQRAATSGARNARAVVTKFPIEVSPDDVMEELCDLFDHLGIDAKTLAGRAKSRNPATASRRLYPHVAAIGELLTSWHQDPAYLDEFGEPLPIKMRGAKRSFSRLAELAVPRMEPKRLLSELERVGAVAIDRKKLIRVHMRSLPVYEDKKLAVQHTLTSLDGFVKTLRHNLKSAPSNSDQLFHRVARTEELDAREIPALKIWVKRHGQSFLESCDNWMARRSRFPSKKNGAKIKKAQVSIGVYLVVEKS